MWVRIPPGLPTLIMSTGDGQTLNLQTRDQHPDGGRSSSSLMAPAPTVAVCEFERRSVSQATQVSLATLR